MQPVAPASNRQICHEVQQQVASVCVTCTGFPGHSSGCTKSAMGDLDTYAFQPAAILRKVVEKLQDSPCKRIMLIAPGWPNMPWFWDLVAMSSQIPLSLPNLLTQPFNQIPHRNLTNLNLHAWLLEPQQSKNRASRIEAPQRVSARSVYEAKWSIFTKWCITNQVDFRAPPVKSVADFLIYLFEDRNLQPSGPVCADRYSKLSIG